LRIDAIGQGVDAVDRNNFRQTQSSLLFRRGALAQPPPFGDHAGPA
jgi:hypothetical protein